MLIRTLQNIIQDINTANSVDEALAVLLKGVHSAFYVDAVNIYLAEGEGERKRFVLRATEGLNERAIGRVRMALGEGLVGTVAQRSEPLNTDDAPHHPNFKYFPEAGEDPLNSFLGVPIIYFGDVQGVLVVQQRQPRLFNEDQIAFLMTLAAQISGGITQAINKDEVGDKKRTRLLDFTEPTRIQGLAGAQGVSIGRAVVVYAQADIDAVPNRASQAVDADIELFKTAVTKTQSYIARMRKRMQGVLPKGEIVLFDAYAMMLDGGSLIEDTIAHIRAGQWPQGALRKAIEEHVRVFMDMDDVYLRQRADDVKDLGQLLLRSLQDKKREKQIWPDKTILVGANISATQLAEVPHGKLAGVVCLHGSGTSHVAILASAMGVPAVMGVKGLSLAQMNEREVVVDGYAGYIVVDPSWTLKREYTRLIKQESEQNKALEALRDEPATTTDGFECSLFVNTGLVSDIGPSLRAGAQGIGLYRTEIPFQVRTRFPSEDEQKDTYKEVLSSFSGKPVVIRTLDIGGDKPLEYFPIKEDNPFLGWRGIRVTLDQPELFLNQVRALLKANYGLNNLQILLPMIGDITQVLQAKKLIQRAHKEVSNEGFATQMPRIGAMIEVPSAIYLMDAMASHVDFFSVGTNDLTQYLLAVDRNNERVAKLYDSLHPAVLKAVKDIAQTAQRYEKPLSICGEMAANPLSLLCLLGMDINSFSMSAGSLPRAKKVIRSISSEQAHHILSHVLTLSDTKSIRTFLKRELDGLGLGGLTRAGR